jgi:integrase
VFKKTFTKPLPANAELYIRKGRQFARWKDSKEKTRTALVTVPKKGGHQGEQRVVIESPYFVAKYRDGSGLVVECSTGCRDETAARGVLADLERRAELVRAKVLTSAQDAISKHQPTPLAEHFDAYREHLRASGATEKHIKECRHYLDRLAADCAFTRLADLKAEVFERWLAQRIAEGMSARSRNAYREAIVAFCNWAVDKDRLASNAFAKVAKANVKADPRRPRRAMDETELVKVLDAAQRRPLLDDAARDRPEIWERRKLIGRERALIYKTLVLTGLRKGELASLTVGQLDLDGPVAYAALDAADEKNREGTPIPIRRDLATDLRQWLADKLQRLQAEAR